jgi:glycerophosphoryl diester phosphodiesterase
MKWIAHRGYHQNAVENSLKAFKKAIEEGYDGIECDLRLTSDNAFIVYHDDTFMRLHGINKKVRSVSLKEALSYTYLEDDSENTLDLNTLLKWMHQKKRVMLIEIKDKLNHKQAHALLNTLSSYEINYVIISFHIQNIRLMSQLKTMWLISKVTKMVIKRANIHQIKHLGCDVQSMTPHILHDTIRLGFSVSLWTVNVNQHVWSKFPLTFITTDLKQ